MGGAWLVVVRIAVLPRGPGHRWRRLFSDQTDRPATTC